MDNTSLLIYHSDMAHLWAIRAGYFQSTSDYQFALNQFEYHWGKVRYYANVSQ